MKLLKPKVSGRRNSMKRRRSDFFLVTAVFMFGAVVGFNRLTPLKAMPVENACDPREIDALIQQLQAKDVTVVNNASRTLAKIGSPAVASLVTALQQADGELSITIVQVFGRMGDKAADAVEALIGVLRQENDSFLNGHPLSVNRREEVAYALSRLGGAAVPPLIEVLSDTDKEVVYYALQALRHMVGEVQEAAPALIHILDDESERIREMSALALGEIAASKSNNLAQAVVLDLIRLLNDESSYVRQAASIALGNIGDKIAVPALIERLQDEDESVRGDAAVALGRIGPPAQAALPHLKNILRCENDSIRRRILSGLGGIGTQAVIPTLIEALDDESVSVRKTAICQLGKIGQPVEIVVPVLMKTLEDPDVRSESAFALSLIGEPAVGALIQGFSDEADAVRHAAAYALTEMGEAAQAAVPVLIEALSDKAVGVRRSAAFALRHIEGINQAAVPALKHALTDEDKQVRIDAALTLRQIAPAEVPSTFDEQELIYVKVPRYHSPCLEKDERSISSRRYGSRN